MLPPRDYQRLAELSKRAISLEQSINMRKKAGLNTVVFEEELNALNAVLEKEKREMTASESLTYLCWNCHTQFTYEELGGGHTDTINFYKKGEKELTAFVSCPKCDKPGVWPQMSDRLNDKRRWK